MSGIEWTDATWNPVVGCSVVSPGCTNCYAMGMAARLEAMGTEHYKGLTRPSKGGPVWTGKLALAPEPILMKPLSWRKPRRVFVNSMGDLFHERVRDELIDRVFAVMASSPQHTFQVLTKRSERMRDYINSAAGRVGDAIQPLRRDDCAVGPVPHLDGGQHWWPLHNVWLGVSVEDQDRADQRIPPLLDTPAAVRFASAEPLLAPLGLTHVLTRGGYLNALSGDHFITDDLSFQHSVDGPTGRLDWVIVGGESGRGARPMSLEWARAIIRQCKAAAVPVFMKQLGSRPTNMEPRLGKGGHMADWPKDLRVREWPIVSRQRRRS